MIPMGISQITSSILNAIGLELKSLKNYGISSLLLILCIYFLPKYIGTYSLIVGYLLMSSTSSVMNIFMLKKRNLVSFEFIKTALKMISIAIFSALIGFSIYFLFAKYWIISLFISATVTMLSMCLLIYIFNIADVKMFLFKNKKRTKALA